MLDGQTIKQLVGNSIFTVKFTKKNGDLRKLTGRLGVKRGVKGVGKNYDVKDFNYLTVYEMGKEQFRTINFNTIKELTFKGNTYKF